ncbi:MAG: hypothetical protein ACLPTZ_14265 [Beijerinckiaceae bacterium]
MTARLAMAAAEFEVLTRVEHVEDLIVLTWTEEIGPKACPTPRHLPEFGF